MIAGIINLLLLIYLIKNRKERKQDLIIFLVIAVMQVALYLPWLISFISNLKGTGFWITLTFPGTIYDILTIHYAGNLAFQPIILSTAFYAYVVYLFYQTKKNEVNSNLNTNLKNDIDFDHGTNVNTETNTYETNEMSDPKY